VTDVAIITGGASGIGRALAEALAARGVAVVVADRQIELAEEVARGISSRGGVASARALDVRDRAAFQALADETAERFGGIDFLFNNAGIGVGGEMADYESRDWDDVIDVNLRGVVHGVQAVYPKMVAQRSGHIVNTASLAGLVPAVFEGSYTTSKHAVVGLSKALRIEAQRHNVRVSVLCPGPIKTPILEGGAFGRFVVDISQEKLREIWSQVRPMPVDEFAQKALRQIMRDVPIIIVPAWWKALWYLERASPSLSLRLWGTILDRLRAEIEADGVAVRARG
jgi:NAD(P)-dependent dehydrogenase (short-subunit alcohol dehydrogenase family)